MDKNKKKFFLKYIANLSLIAMCTFFLNTNVICAEGQEGADENTNIYLKKCTDLYRVDKNLTLDDDLDYVEKYLEIVIGHQVETLPTVSDFIKPDKTYTDEEFAELMKEYQETIKNY